MGGKGGRVKCGKGGKFKMVGKGKEGEGKGEITGRGKHSYGWGKG